MAWIEDECGNFLMVRQAQGKRLWTLPGGKVKAVEKLDAALRRELLEEIGERIRAARPIGIFDRPEKRNLTVLYRVSLIGRRLRSSRNDEISAVEFKARPPANRSPSAGFFWKLRESGGFRW